MHRDNIAPRDLAGRSRKLCSKQFVSELHDQGYTRDDAIEAVCQVFCVPYRAARLFVVSHPAWAGRCPRWKNPGLGQTFLHALRSRSRTASSFTGVHRCQQPGGHSDRARLPPRRANTARPGRGAAGVAR